MKFTKLAITMLCSVVLLCGCVKNNGTAIKINDKVITKAEFYSDFDRVKNAQLKNAPKEFTKNNSYIVLSLKDKFVKDVITRELLSQEFEKRKIEATEEEIKAKKDQIIAQIGEEQYNKILKESKITPERVNQDMANEVKMDKLINSIASAKVTDAEIQKFYTANKSQFNLPERVRVSHILIDANPDNIKRKITDADKAGKMSAAEIDKQVEETLVKQEALAKEVQAKAAKNPKDFAKLAKEYSQDPESAKVGGDLGYITKEGGVVKEFSDVAFKQKVGTVSPIVKTQFGYHIILVQDKAAAGLEPLSKVKADLAAYLTQQKKLEALQKLVTGLKDSATIEFGDESLKPENIKAELDKALKEQLAKEKNKPALKDMKNLEKNDK